MPYAPFRSLSLSLYNSHPIVVHRQARRNDKDEELVEWTAERQQQRVNCEGRQMVKFLCWASVKMMMMRASKQHQTQFSSSLFASGSRHQFPFRVPYSYRCIRVGADFWSAIAKRELTWLTISSDALHAFLFDLFSREPDNFFLHHIGTATTKLFHFLFLHRPTHPSTSLPPPPPACDTIKKKDISLVPMMINEMCQSSEREICVNYKTISGCCRWWWWWRLLVEICFPIRNFIITEIENLNLNTWSMSVDHRHGQEC